MHNAAKCRNKVRLVSLSSPIDIQMSYLTVISHSYLININQVERMRHRNAIRSNEPTPEVVFQTIAPEIKTNRAGIGDRTQLGRCGVVGRCTALFPAKEARRAPE